jgi:hypothetical protein
MYEPTRQDVLAYYKGITSSVVDLNSSYFKALLKYAAEDTVTELVTTLRRLRNIGLGIPCIAIYGDGSSGLYRNGIASRPDVSSGGAASDILKLVESELERIKRAKITPRAALDELYRRCAGSSVEPGCVLAQAQSLEELYKIACDRLP